MSKIKTDVYLLYIDKHRKSGESNNILSAYFPIINSKMTHTVFGHPWRAGFIVSVYHVIIRNRAIYGNADVQKFHPSISHKTNRYGGEKASK
jgi:hypothetical protein